jgi:hypothetical protein
VAGKVAFTVAGWILTSLLRARLASTAADYQASFE